MTQKDSISEKNKIIALFEEMELHNDDPDYGEVFRLKGDKFGISRYPVHELKYHSDWSWLMPVVKKIESMHLVFTIYQKEASIVWLGAEDENYPWLQQFDSVYSEGKNKIEAVYNACFHFITWYNKTANRE